MKLCMCTIIVSLFYYFYPVKQVFGEMEFVGWYTNGDVPSADDSTLHQQVIITIADTPLYIHYNVNRIIMLIV